MLKQTGSLRTPHRSVASWGLPASGFSKGVLEPVANALVLAATQGQHKSRFPPSAEIERPNSHRHLSEESWLNAVTLAKSRCAGGFLVVAECSAGAPTEAVGVVGCG